jgi:eukaryotic-like serine/threonine-protein kinase
MGAVRGRALVLSSRCHENEFLAHKALDGIVDGLFREFDQGPLFLLEGLPRADRSALVQVFPVLRPLFQFGVPDDAGSDPFQTVHSARRAAFRGLRTLLSRLSRRMPLVLIIDDLQWADADSLLALESLMTEELPRRMLLVMAARTGTEAPRLEIPLRQLELGALDAESATKLARSLLEERESNPISAAAVAEEARGLPLFVEMLAHYSGTQDATPSVELDSLLRARLGALVDSQRRVLELLSAAAGPVGQKQLSAASGVKLANLVAEVRDLQIGHWVVTRQSEGDTTVEPYHDSVRHAVVASMGIERRRETHHDWAVAIERAPEGSDPEVLARHWVSAGAPERAVDYVIEAARRAERALAFDRAAKLYGWALELGIERHPKHAELTHRHAESLSNAGRARDAATAYLRASEIASAGDRWGYQLRAAEQLLRAGYVDEGLKTVDRLVRSLGMTLPSHPIDGMVRLVGERLLGTKVLSRFFSRSSEPSDELTRKADACYAVALGLSQVDPFASAAFTARYMRYAYALGDDRRIALGLCLRAPQAAAAGPPATGAYRLLSRVRAVVGESSGKGRLEAHLALAEAGVAFLLGDFAATLRIGRTALSMFARLPGSTWEIGTVQRYVLTSLWHTGQLQELERHTKQLLEDADDRKDRYTANQLRTTVVPIVHLKNDEPERALAELTRADRDLPPPKTSLQRWQHRQHEALVALYLGKPFEALALMKEQKAGAGRLILRRVAAMRISTAFHRATAILAAMASREHLKIRGWSTMLQRDIRSIRRATLEHIPCLLEAQLAYWNRDPATSRALLERAEGLFVESGMALFAAVCAWGLGTVDARDPTRRARAEHWMKEQGIKNPRKFVQLLAPVFAH